MIKYLNLLIGSACNMKCGYCLQTNGRSLADHKTNPVEFAQKLVKYLGGQKIERIAYWGGEPMLYWPTIKALHSELKRLGLSPKQSVITTNGRSLTQEYVDYANGNPDIFTVVSWHDGDFTEEQLNLIFKLKSFSISLLIHHYQKDLREAKKIFWELFEKYGIYPKVCCHFLRANDGCSSDYYMTKEDVDDFCLHLETVLQMALLGDDWAIWQCNQLLFHRNQVKKRVGAMCVRPELLSVDLHGNIYACHHNYDASNVTGNIFKKIVPIATFKQFSPERYFSSEECQQCEYLEECRGGCYTSNTHELDCYFAKKRAKIFEKMERVLR